MESEGERCTHIVINTLHYNYGISVAEMSIDKAHRIGKAFGDKPRPMMVRFNAHTVRDKASAYDGEVQRAHHQG